MITAQDIGKEKTLSCSLSKYGQPYLKVKSARFECPACGSILSTFNQDSKEPRCSCGRRSGFKMIDKEAVETQEITISEICKVGKGFSFYDYKVYVEGLELIDKVRQITSDFKLVGEVKDEYKKDKGQFVIFAKDIILRKKEEVED